MYVPSSAIVTTLSASQVAGLEDGVIKHVAFAPLVCNCVPVAKPEVPVMVVYVAVPPGSTDCVCAVAVGAVGAATVGVIIASSIRPSESAT